jgi:hypothetical protein
MTYAEVLRVARLLGLRAVSPMSITACGIRELLQAHGPLWTHGRRHIVVIAGVDELADLVYVHDPAPIGFGSKGWRSLTSWFVRSEAPDSRAVGTGTRASFLYHP